MVEPGAQFARSVLGPLQAAPAGPVGRVVIGRGDDRPFIGDSPLHPLERLARYRPDAPGEAEEASTWSDPVRKLLGLNTEEGAGTGVRFHAVQRGELQEVPRVYVFVHGWLPGSRDVTEELLLEEGPALAWDERVSNKVGLSMVQLYEPLLAALAQRDPEAAVLWYSWVDQSGTDTDLFAARSSLGNTGVNGRRLAAALSLLVGGSSPGLHLIGHSHGSVVAAYAALGLNKPVAHLTLLDCPEDWFSRAGGAAGLLPTILPRLRPGRGPGATFVDAYASMFGRSYHDVPGLSELVDVRLAPLVRRSDPAAPVSQAHQFPVNWYAATVTDEDAEGGFAWSPLHGFDTSELGTAYLATAKGRLTELIRHRAKAPKTEADQVLTTLSVAPQELRRQSPDVVCLTTLPQDALAVEFDVRFERPGQDTRVDIAVNGQLTCTVYAQAPLPVKGRFVRVEPGRNAIQFRMVDPGLRSSAEVYGLRMRRGRVGAGNLDDTAAATTIAALGAAAGAAATAALFLAGLTIRAALRRLRTPAEER